MNYYGEPDDCVRCSDFVSVAELEKFIFVEIIDYVDMESVDRIDSISAEIEGAKDLKTYCDSVGRKCYLLGFDVSDRIARERLNYQGICESAIHKRLSADEKLFSDLFELCDVFFSDFDVDSNISLLYACINSLMN